MVAEGTQPSSDPSGIFGPSAGHRVQEAPPRLHASSSRFVVSLGRSRKSNSILGLTYFKSTGSSGRQRHGRDIREDYREIIIDLPIGFPIKNIISP